MGGASGEGHGGGYGNANGRASGQGGGGNHGGGGQGGGSSGNGGQGAGGGSVTAAVNASRDNAGVSESESESSNRDDGGFSKSAAVSNTLDDGGFSKSAGWSPNSFKDDGYSKSANGLDVATGEEIATANREVGISDAMTAHNLALNGYDYGDRVSALTGSFLDAAAPNLGFTGHGLISAALSMVPGVGLALNAADIGQKAYTNGVSSISAKDGAGLVAGGLSLAGLGPAALAVRTASALNDAMDGNGGSLGSMAGGFAGNLAGSLTGNPYAGQVGGIIGSQLGGKVGQGDGTQSDNSGGKDASQGGNGDGWSGGSMTAAVNAAAKPKASVAQTQAGYQQPAMKYLNTSEYM